MTKTPMLSILAALALSALANPARALDLKDIKGDVEIDPTAYVLEGYSVHAGLWYDRFRLDLGAYAMAVPGFIHGNKAFNQSFDGFGVKLQYFIFRDRAGAFVGIDSGLTRMTLERDGMSLSSRSNQFGVGVHAGYRFELGRSFYATPWLGVGYAFNAKDVSLGGETFKGQHWIIFPAVHLGYRFN